MADDDVTKKPNGVSIHVSAGEKEHQQQHELITLSTILNRLIAAVFFPDPNIPAPLHHRIRAFCADNAPLLPDAAMNTARNVHLWTRRGSSLRALLVASVGSVALLLLTGLLVFLLFFVAASFSAVVISLLMSLAAIGGVLALFFTCVTAIYVAALSVAIFVISTATISAIIAVFIITGWVGFFWTLWLVAAKIIGLAKLSFSIRGSEVSTQFAASPARNNNLVAKKSD